MKVSKMGYKLTLRREEKRISGMLRCCVGPYPALNPLVSCTITALSRRKGKGFTAPYGSMQALETD